MKVSNHFLSLQPISMISPISFSLFCALLLCLPLAVVFNIYPTTTHKVVEDDMDGTSSVQISTIDGYKELRIVGMNFYDGILVGLGVDVERLSLEGVGDGEEFVENGAKVEEIEETQKSQPPPFLLSPPPLPPIRIDYKEDYVKLNEAALVNSRARTPFKVAFMFLITDALPFAPLWEAFFRPAPSNMYNVYIHADPSFKNSALGGVFANRLIESKPTRRYSPTLISAARRLLAHALLQDSSNSHFALISASCIPVHSFKFVYKTLASSRKSFIEMLPHEPGAYGRWAARGDSAMLPDVPFDMSRIGSQFWLLTRRHARTVVRDKRMWSKFKQECTRWYDCYPEESYFPTLLSVRDEKGCVPATLTHVDWRGREDGHPRTYSAEEVDTGLILRLRSERPRYGDEEVEAVSGINVVNGSDSGVSKRWHPFLFARKFDADALEPLMKIAGGVILKD